MARYTSAWARPIQGVSQQAPQVRLPGQCTEQVNAVPSAVEGLIKRWGTQHIARLMEVVSDKAKFHFYNRGDREQYLMVFLPGGDIRIFSSKGVEAKVERIGMGSYLDVQDPSLSLSLVTISDTTFIASSQTTPKASSAETTGLSNTGIASVQFADYGKTYSVTVDGQYTGSYKTPTGEAADDINLVDTSYVARQVYDSLRESISSGYVVSRESNVLYIRRTDGRMPRLETEDGRDGDDFIPIVHRVTSVNKLPTRAPNGYLIEVVGEGSEGDDPYWLVSERNEGGSVRWKETTGPGQSVGFDKNTMPHKLVRTSLVNGVATFTLSPSDWENRLVGTEDTNAMPAFVSDAVPIRSIGVFQNRLYVTAGQNVTFTQSNYFTNFFRRTSRALVDDQRVEIYADTDDISFLQNGCILDGDLVFFSDSGQFMIRGDQPMTHENANLRLVSQYECTLECTPVAAGNVVFFPFEDGKLSGMRELYTDTYTDTKKARSISDHVKGYITGTVRQMTTSTNLNTLLLLSGKRDRVCTYNWQFDDQQQRAQSAWGEWVFKGANVRFLHFDRDLVYVAIERNGEGLYLEVFQTGDPDTDNLGFPVRLDRLSTVTATKDGEVWRFSHALPEGSYLSPVFARGEGCLELGAAVSVGRDDSGLYTTDHLSDADGEVQLYCGESYQFKYVPTPPFIKDQNDSVIGTDRLMIHRVIVSYDRIGQVDVNVRNAWKVEYNYTFNGRQVGQFDNFAGFSTFGSGQFQFPVHQVSNRSTYTLTSDSHVPFSLRGMEWEGTFKQRGRRI